MPPGRAFPPKRVDPELQMLDDMIEELRLRGGEDAPESIAEGLKIRERHVRKLAIWEARARIAQEATALRYRKGAVNQLIKALKGLEGLA